MKRVNLMEKYPAEPGESTAAWTDRLMTRAREHGTFRQCSIGWHEECSDQYGDSCQCSCHAIGITLTRDQLEAWAGRELTDEEVAALDEAIPHGSIPEAIRTIADNIGQAGGK